MDVMVPRRETITVASDTAPAIIGDPGRRIMAVRRMRAETAIAMAGRTLEVTGGRRLRTYATDLVASEIPRMDPGAAMMATAIATATTTATKIDRQGLASR